MLTRFVVCDPARVTGRHEISPGGDVSRELTTSQRNVLAIAISIVAAVALVVSNWPGNPIAIALFTLIFYIPAIIVLLIIEAVVSAIIGHRREKSPVGLLLGFESEPAVDICATFIEIVETQAWVQRAVDPKRELPAILWQVALKARQLDDDEAEARRAVDFASLADLSAATLATVQQGRAVLHEVHEHLGSVLTAAREIDAVSQARRHDLARETEEDRLRKRLASSNPSLAGAESDQAQDDSVRLAAASEAASSYIQQGYQLLRNN